MVQKLTSEQIEKLTNLQNKISESVLNIGEGHLRVRDLTLELNRINSLISKFEGEFDELNKQYTEYLAELEKIYPNGEIDLVEGTVTIAE
jgi:predicted nuclease with TOPRIM domain